MSKELENKLRKAGHSDPQNGASVIEMSEDIGQELVKHLSVYFNAFLKHADPANYTTGSMWETGSFKYNVFNTISVEHFFKGDATKALSWFKSMVSKILAKARNVKTFEEAQNFLFNDRDLFEAMTKVFENYSYYRGGPGSHDWVARISSRQSFEPFFAKYRNYLRQQSGKRVIDKTNWFTDPQIKRAIKNGIESARQWVNHTTRMADLWLRGHRDDNDLTFEESSYDISDEWSPFEWKDKRFDSRLKTALNRISSSLNRNQNPIKPMNDFVDIFYQKWDRPISNWEGGNLDYWFEEADELLKQYGLHLYDLE